MPLPIPTGRPFPFASVSERWQTAGTVFGVDGCPGGWAVVEISAVGALAARASFAGTLGPLLGRGAIAIDIPIGLPDQIVGPGRGAEQAIRPLLGKRAASVFSMPSRAAVFAPDWESACALALQTSDPPRKPSKQGFNIFPKIREVDALLTPDTEAGVFETHAELAFWRLNGETAMDTAKTVPGVPAAAALESRIAVLVRHGFRRTFFASKRPKGVPLVDMVDAAALALIARRCREGTAQPFPDPPQRDSRGLRAAIWA